jgi:hypothetical protein
VFNEYAGTSEAGTLSNGPWYLRRVTLRHGLRFFASLHHLFNDLAASCIQSKQKAGSLHATFFDLEAATRSSALSDSAHPDLTTFPHLLFLVYAIFLSLR